MGQLVSVIIPCYNAEKRLPDTLASVERQTYGDIEIVCVNDGSTDGTERILNDFKGRSVRLVRTLTTDNCGVSAARNAGLRMASGKCVMFLDADDQYAECCVEELARAMEAEHADTSYSYWTRDAKELRRIAGKGKEKSQRDILRHYMYRPTPVSFVNFLYRKDILDRFSIRFAEDLRYGEDNLFFYQYLRHIQTGIYFPVPLYYYRDNPDSALHTPSWRSTDALVAIERAETYLEESRFPWLRDFLEYAPARTVFYILKEFARYGQRDYFDRFYREANGQAVAELARKNGLPLTLAALLLAYAPRVFYHIVSRISG